MGPIDSAQRTRRLVRKLPFLAVLIAAEIFIFWHYRAADGNQTATSAASLAAPSGLPESVVHQFNQLKEDQAASYPFFLSKESRVRVEVTATPKPVDVMVMTGDDAAKFDRAHGMFFAFLAPDYTYRKSLSAQEVTTLDRTDILPPGNWVIVVLRPHESVFFKKATSASTVLTVY